MSWGYLKHKPILIIIISAVILILTASLLFEGKYANSAYPGVKIGDIKLGGLSQTEIEKILNDKADDLNQKGITFKYNDKEINVNPTVSSLSADWAYQILYLDTKKTAEAAYNFGRQGIFFQKIGQRIRGLIRSKEISLIYDLDREKLKEIIKENFAEIESPAENATLVYIEDDKNDNPQINFDVLPESLGRVINLDQALTDLDANLKRIENKTVVLKTMTDYPTIYKDDCLNIDAKAQAIIAIAPATISYEDLKWTVSRNELAGWLALTKNGQEISIDIAETKLKQFITDNIAPKINRDPIKADFKIENGKVSNFQLSQNGLQLNEDGTVVKIKEEIIKNKNNNITLLVETLLTTGEESTLENLGIKEIIGTGHSNFVGSSKSRIHNIANGAATLNGVLIKPGEEFSLIKTLGTIDATNGYLQELVIKGDKTIPEYGGGLCQIGTTLFRTAIATGLPITERRNHSYRVSYYEPAGTDATIYDPKPDVRFINDTNKYIMIQTRMDGNDIYFDFWGESDNRQVSISDPVIYNIVNPAPTRLVETTELKPGEKKCTERSHKGADAYFDYKVIYSDNTADKPHLIDERFSSHYVPWQEVCLIGVEASSTPDIIASSTTNIE